MFTLPPAILDLIFQAVGEAAWNRPELAPLTEPIKQALTADTFRQLTKSAFQTFAENSDLPQFFDEGFIRMPAVQEHLGAYIVKGDQADLNTLADLYAKRHLKPASAPDVRTHLAVYLRQVRETFAADPTYGPILLARDVQSMTAALNNLRGEMHGRFDDVISRLDALLKEPEIKALVERKQGSHIFLSYSRHNLALALQVRNALEDAGHAIWQDTTAIKGGAEWIKSIEDGIERAYAVVTVVTQESQASEWVTIEFLHARRRNKLIVPIKVDGCEIPTMMLAMNVIHGHPDLQAGIAAMLATLPHSERTEPDDKPLDRRDQEIAYLDRMLLEHSVWQTVYTPMAGVAQVRKEANNTEKPHMVTVPHGIESRFKRRLEQSALMTEHPVEVEERPYGDIIPAVNDLKRLVVLGDPGAGKTTTLWAIAVHAAQEAKADASKPLPVFVRLGELSKTEMLKSRIRAQLGDLAPHYEALLVEKRLLFLLDGLNELPAENRDTHLSDIKAIIKTCQSADMRAIVTCRELDYSPLDIGIPEKVLITPLDPLRIHRFVNGYITAPPDAGERLFWLLAGEHAQMRWSAFSKATGESLEIFWLASEMPADKRWDWGDSDERYRNTYWKQWLEERQQPRSMLQLATNPFMLYMITQVFTEEGELPPNRGELFRLFVEFLLLDREKLPEAEAQTLETRLADVAFAMQSQGEGTSFPPVEAMKYLLDETSLYRAQSASLLTGKDEIRFTHQLLQEYFAARRLDREMKNGVPASQVWPPDGWWQPQGWEETAILLAGLYSDDTTPVIEWLHDAQPELTARCILESGAHTPPETQEALRPRWLPRLTQLDKLPAERAAVGRALGLLRLDSREGVGLKDGVPDIEWAEIPARAFQMGGDEKAYNAWIGARINLPYDYWLAKYPVTYAQYEVFVNSDGYSNQRYWTEAGWSWKGEKTQPEYGWHDPEWHISNHPVIGVTWYEAYAFCRWLTEKLGNTLPVGWEIRMPTEAEWEKAARHPDERKFPWGDEFSARKCNVYESELKRTTPVGMYPDGANPAIGIHDLSGNVWEWCVSQWAEEYHYPEDNTAEGSGARVVRGGSWFFQDYDARAASRYGSNPFFGNGSPGFRVVCAAPISSEL